MWHVFEIIYGPTVDGGWKPEEHQVSPAGFPTPEEALTAARALKAERPADTFVVVWANPEIDPSKRGWRRISWQEVEERGARREERTHHLTAAFSVEELRLLVNQTVKAAGQARVMAHKMTTELYYRKSMDEAETWEHLREVFAEELAALYQRYPDLEG